MTAVPPPPTSDPGRPDPDPYASAPTGSPATAQPPYGGPAGQQAPGGYPGAYPGGAPARLQNGLGLASLIVGIIALITSIIPLFGFPLGVVGLVLGILGLGRAKRGLATNRGVALAGVILSSLALLIAIVSGIAGVVLNMSSLGS